MASSLLNDQLKGLGVDVALAKKIVDLENTEKLMKQGKIRPEVYETLVNDVLKGMNKVEKSASKENKLKIRKIQNLFGALGKSQSSKNLNKNKGAVINQPKVRPVLDGYLTRLGKTSKGAYQTGHIWLIFSVDGCKVPKVSTFGTVFSLSIQLSFFFFFSFFHFSVLGY